MNALEKIEDLAECAERARRRALGDGRQFTLYHQEGKITAYAASHKIMKEELRRLRNLWQNNSLTYDSFEVGD